jgi:hypothetical protein
MLWAGSPSLDETMLKWFKRVTYTCLHCGARQRIPLRRIHFFERFHEFDPDQVLLIQCPTCGQGLQMPTPYLTHAGHRVHVDPENPPKTAFIHQTWPGSP